MAALCLGLSTACATQRATTWEDDAKEGISTRRSRTRSSALEAGSGQATSVGAPGPWRRVPPGTTDEHAPTPAELVEMISNFRIQRASFAGSESTPIDPRKPAWPTSIKKLWAKTLHALARGLATEAVPRPVLLQARVAVEVELEDTEARFGPAPPEVRHRVGLVYVLVAQHMRAGASATGRRRTPLSGMNRGKVALEWPVTPVILTSPFGRRRDPIATTNRLGFHAGVDLGGQRGTLVSAAAPGRVERAGWRGGHGRSVTVRHTRDLVTVYSHLGTVFVHEGDDLDLGSPIGLMGSSGRSTGPHLHFEVRQDGKALNPMDFVQRLLLSYAELDRNGDGDGDGDGGGRRSQRAGTFSRSPR
ncbi:MAG: M23 family metallopeptidase [Deltaproteobacteria bacterium]|nr:M23 family metallopeptidase [Deltaproteobacteria bacterium]